MRGADWGADRKVLEEAYPSNLILMLLNLSG
jgi:hypothetical protein